MTTAASQFGSWKTGSFPASPMMRGDHRAPAQQGGHMVRHTAAGSQAYVGRNDDRVLAEHNPMGAQWDWDAPQFWQDQVGPRTDLVTVYVDVIDTGLSLETDSALNPGLAMGLGLSTETDTSLALTANLVIVTGLSLETDAALNLGIGVTAGVSTETGVSLNLGLALGLGRANETDTSLNLGIAHGVGRSNETDTSLALLLGSSGFSAPAGLSGETDVVFALGTARPWGLATEIDLALALDLLVIIPPTFWRPGINRQPKFRRTRQGRRMS